MRSTLLLLAISFFSCGGPETTKDDDDGSFNDSLFRALDAPELGEINGRILADPSNDSLYRERALIYQRLKQPEAAANDMKRAIRIDSTDARNYLTLVDLYFSQNQTRLAKDLLLIVEKKFPQNTEALLKLAELYWLVRQYQNGLTYVNRALRINEHLARAYYIKGGIYRESGDTTRAVSSLLTAVEQDNKYVDAFYDLGVIYGARRNPIAFQYYDNVLRLAPAHNDARYGRAKLLQDLGKTDEAIAAYEQLLSADERCVRCHYNLGAIMVELKKDYEAALKHFSEAIRLEPDNPDHYFARGYTYSRLGETANARADYQMCLKIDHAYDAASEGLRELDKK